jgi:Domain of unknown function (DUF4373)
MKWFKHDSDASNDAKLKKLRLKYGAQGYGIYWYCLELISRNVDKHNLTFELEHDAELIADDFKLSADLVQHIMTYMVELELFENTNNIITCLKMATRTDEYTQKLIQGANKCPDKLPTLSVHNPKKSVLIEEKRTEENILEDKTKRETTIPKDFSISDKVILWAEKNNHTNLQKHFDNFVLSCQARNYKYTNWDAAFMKAIRDNWAGVQAEKKNKVVL